MPVNPAGLMPAPGRETLGQTHMNFPAGARNHPSCSRWKWQESKTPPAPDKQQHKDAEGKEGRKEAVGVCSPAGHNVRSQHPRAPATERLAASALCDTLLTVGQNHYRSFH